MNAPWPLPGIDAVLALDLATKTGFSLACRLGDEYDPSRIVSGTWNLQPIRTMELRLLARHEDPRPAGLLHRILAVCGPIQGTILFAWEDVEFVSSRDQITCWAGLRAAVLCAGETSALNGTRVQFYSVPVGTLKKFATGSGRAEKVDMERAAVAAHLVPPDHGLDDNGIDARWILEYTLRTYNASIANSIRKPRPDPVRKPRGRRPRRRP